MERGARAMVQRVAKSQTRLEGLSTHASVLKMQLRSHLPQRPSDAHLPCI